MKLIFSLILLLFVAVGGKAQSETTQRFIHDHSDVFSIFFYHNTLMMFNQQDNKEFDAAIKNIEKMRFMIVDKKEQGIDEGQYKKLVSSYRKESYENAMSARREGKHFDVYLKGKDGSPDGTVVLVNDSTNLYVLDILGSVDIAKIPQFFSSLQQGGDLGNDLKSFIDQAVKLKKGGKGSVENN
jgi:Domain of unknown function (DUF4252)